MAVSPRQTARMTREARNALFTRLHDGGTSMPPFAHLNNLETRSLVGYLQQLAGVPDSAKDQAVIQESEARIGELIVKSTCHICHGATGSNPTPVELLQGAIPPLNSLPKRVTQAQLIRKVTQGAPVIMGAMPLISRGRMPVFDYITPDEAEDVYTYLIQYPPTQSAEGDDPAGSEALNALRRSAGAMTQLVAQPHRATQERHESLAWPLGLGSIVVILVAIEFWVTFRELRKLSARPPAERRPAARAKISDVDSVVISVKAQREFLARKIS